MRAIAPLANAALALVVLVALPLGTARAESWVVGDPLRLATDAPQANADLSLEFTPRVGPLSLDDVRLSLSVGADPVGPDDDRGSAAARLDETNERLGMQGFVVGGALAVDDVVVSAELAQRSNAFGQSETWRAALSKGRVTTALSYTDGIEGGDGQRFAVGTAVETAPGISLGADLALDEGGSEDGAPDAAGVLRFKLEF